MVKDCKTCGETKPLDQFSPVTRGRLGRASDCKRCAADKKAAYRAANPERIRAANQKHYAANAERMRADKRAYNVTNADRRAAYMHRYRADNPTAHRDWARANPDKVAAQRHRRRARIAKNGFETYSLTDVYEESDYRCAYCSGPIEHLDHIIPVAKGGADTRTNVIGACALCNQTKSDMDPEEWIGRVLASDKPVWAR